MRIHRIGTITLGSILILFGGLFFCRIFIPGLTYEAVFRLWPLILILFGAETLYCSNKYESFSYDFGAVCMALLPGFLTVYGLCRFGLSVDRNAYDIEYKSSMVENGHAAFIFLYDSNS